MKSKRDFFLLLMVIGIALFCAAVFVFDTEETKMISGLCIGIGAAIFGLGIGWLIRSFIVSEVEDQQIQKQKDIEVKDERNTQIREKTGYMVSRVMNYVLSAFIMILGFMGADRIIIYMAAGLLAIEFGLVIYYSNHFAKIL